MRRLFFLVFALLVYGSLYPWRFNFWGPIWPAAVHAFHAWPPRLTFDILMDMALNVVVYAPLGLTGYLSTAPGFRWARALWPVGFAFLFSWSVETLQAFLPGRVPSGMDLTCNTLGAAAGVVIGAGYESVIVRWFGSHTGLLRGQAMRRPSSALMMLIVFAGHYLVTLSSNAIKMLTVFHHPALSRVWDWPEFFNGAAGWLLAGRLAEAIAAKPAAGKRSRALPLMFGALLLAAATRAFSPNLLFTWPMLAGAVIGVLAWEILEGGEFEPTFAVLAAVWLIGDGLRPYTFTDRKNFEWIPFLGLLGGDWTVGVSSLLNKLWMYGATFWMWERAGLTRPRAAAILLAVLVGIEYAQKFLPVRVSTMTDIAMGAIACGLLWTIERKYGA